MSVPADVRGDMAGLHLRGLRDRRVLPAKRLQPGQSQLAPDALEQAIREREEARKIVIFTATSGSAVPADPRRSGAPKSDGAVGRGPT